MKVSLIFFVWSNCLKLILVEFRGNAYKHLEIKFKLDVPFFQSQLKVLGNLQKSLSTSKFSIQNSINRKFFIHKNEEGSIDSRLTLNTLETNYKLHSKCKGSYIIQCELYILVFCFWLWSLLLVSLSILLILSLFFKWNEEIKVTSDFVWP